VPAIEKMKPSLPLEIKARKRPVPPQRRPIKAEPTKGVKKKIMEARPRAKDIAALACLLFWVLEFAIMAYSS